MTGPPAGLTIARSSGPLRVHRQHFPRLHHPDQPGLRLRDRQRLLLPRDGAAQGTGPEPPGRRRVGRGEVRGLHPQAPGRLLPGPGNPLHRPVQVRPLREVHARLLLPLPEGRPDHPRPGVLPRHHPVGGDRVPPEQLRVPRPGDRAVQPPLPQHHTGEGDREGQALPLREAAGPAVHRPGEHGQGQPGPRPRDRRPAAGEHGPARPPGPARQRLRLPLRGQPAHGHPHQHQPQHRRGQGGPEGPQRRGGALRLQGHRNPDRLLDRHRRVSRGRGGAQCPDPAGGLGAGGGQEERKQLPAVQRRAAPARPRSACGWKATWPRPSTRSSSSCTSSPWWTWRGASAAPRA